MFVLSLHNYVDDLKMCTMERFLGVSRVYLNANIALIEDGANNCNYYLIKYLNSLSLFRLPLFNLELKIGCLIMLLQTIASRLRFCNGLYLIIMLLID